MSPLHSLDASQTAVLSLGLGVCEVVCERFKKETSVSDSTLGPLDIISVSFLSQAFWGSSLWWRSQGPGCQMWGPNLHSSRRSAGFPRSLPTVSYCFRAGTCRDRGSRFPTQLSVALLTFHVVFRSFSEGNDPHVATIWCVQRRRGGQGLPVPLSWTLFLALIFPDILLQHVKIN